MRHGVGWCCLHWTQITSILLFSPSQEHFKLRNFHESLCKLPIRIRYFNKLEEELIAQSNNYFHLLNKKAQKKTAEFNKSQWLNTLVFKSGCLAKKTENNFMHSKDVWQLHKTVYLHWQTMINNDDADALKNCWRWLSAGCLHETMEKTFRVGCHIVFRKIKIS